MIEMTSQSSFHKKAKEKLGEEAYNERMKFAADLAEVLAREAPEHEMRTIWAKHAGCIPSQDDADEKLISQEEVGVPDRTLTEGFYRHRFEQIFLAINDKNFTNSKEKFGERSFALAERIGILVLERIANGVMI